MKTFTRVKEDLPSMRSISRSWFIKQPSGLLVLNTVVSAVRTDQNQRLGREMTGVGRGG